MTQNTALTADQAPSETLVRFVWAVATLAVVVVFFFLAWLGKQRAEIFIVQFEKRRAEANLVALQSERDATVRELNERLSKADAGRFAAEQRAREAALKSGKSFPEPLMAPAEMTKSEPATTMRTEINGSSAQMFTMFVKEHLSRMMGSVDAQLPDYADDVDFHDKPHASIRTIENDRKQWALRFPVRVIAVDEVQPQFSAVQDATYGWIATASFTWKWAYTTRSGSVVRGLTRDTWRMAPSPQGLKIISEHSADPATGQSKD